MPFIWLSIGDEAGPASLRSYIERNSIALRSNYQKPPLDPPSPARLGSRCDRDLVRASGVWNSKHFDERYEPAFLDRLDLLISETGPRRMILVIQCAGSKRSDAGHLVSPAGKPVLVVANPETAPADDAFVHARPDDLSDNGGGAFRGQKGAGPTAALAFLASVAI